MPRCTFFLLAVAALAGVACTPCGSAQYPLVEADAGPVRCVTADDCPRTGNDTVCVTTSSLPYTGACVACISTACVRRVETCP